MPRVNSCPNCNQQIEFLGIAHYKNKATNRRVVHVKWYDCSTCGLVHAQNFETGNIVLTRKMFTKDELRGLFPTTGDNPRRSGARKAAPANV